MRFARKNNKECCKDDLEFRTDLYKKILKKEIGEGVM